MLLAYWLGTQHLPRLTLLATSEEAVSANKPPNTSQEVKPEPGLVVKTEGADDALNLLRAACDALHVKIADFERAVKAEDARIAGLESEIQEQNRKISEVDIAMQRKDEEISDLEAQVAEMQKFILDAGLFKSEYILEGEISFLGLTYV